MKKLPANFDEFWTVYLNDHQSPINRTLHVVGTVAALLLAVFAVVSRMPLLLLLVPVCGYGLAWVGHFFIEHNRPTAFRQPLWSLRADMKMTRLLLSGQFRAELQRVQKIAIVAGVTLAPLSDMLSDMC